MFPRFLFVVRVGKGYFKLQTSIGRLATSRAQLWQSSQVMCKARRVLLHQPNRSMNEGARRVSCAQKRRSLVKKARTRSYPLFTLVHGNRDRKCTAHSLAVPHNSYNVDSQVPNCYGHHAINYFQKPVFSVGFVVFCFNWITNDSLSIWTCSQGYLLGNC